MSMVRKDRCMTVLVLAGLIMASVVAVTAEDSLTTQEGLPPELVISSQTPVEEQIAVLESLAAYAAQNAPQSGFLAGCKSMVAGETKPLFISIPDLVASVEVLKGKLVAVEGIYQTISEDRGAFVTHGGTCHIALAGGSLPAGFGKEGPQGLPARAEGIVEITDNGLPLVRAQKLTPALVLTHIRLARAYEVSEEYQKAVQSYKKATSASTQQPYQFAPFASSHAATLALHQLSDIKQARGLYSKTWNTYGKNRPDGGQYYTWVLADGTWENQTVRQAISEPLDSLERDGLWYKVVDFFALVCGGNPALGLLLLALVTRVAIYPLTKKQLASGIAMQRLQPEIKKLQNKYKDNKQKFQEEFWKLCRSHNVNPLGGCLPLLVQMPILIMIYRGIRAYIVQFDGASFGISLGLPFEPFWVSNLAQPHLPILIAYTISMVAFQQMTQKMNPSAQMNPQQQQQQQMMTWLMPLMFFFLFQSFPAAFILYWLGTNLVYFGLQYWFMKTHPPDLTEGTAPPAQHKGGFLGVVTRALSGSGSDESRKGHEEGPASYEELKAKEEGKKVRKDPDSQKRKR